MDRCFGSDMMMSVNNGYFMVKFDSMADREKVISVVVLGFFLTTILLLKNGHQILIQVKNALAKLWCG